MGSLLDALGIWITSVIRSGGYLSVILLMALESACIPLPSEVIMPFAGALTLASIAGSAQAHESASCRPVGRAWLRSGQRPRLWRSARGAGASLFSSTASTFCCANADVEKSETWFQTRGATTGIYRPPAPCDPHLYFPARGYRQNAVCAVYYSFRLRGRFPGATSSPGSASKWAAIWT